MFTISVLLYKDLDKAIDFLTKHEFTCVSLMARVLKCKELGIIKNQTIYKILNSEEKVHGIFLITNSGILLHHILPCNIANLLIPILKRKKLFSIAGTSEASHLFESILASPPSSVFDYHIMLFSEIDTLLSNKKKLDKKFTLLKCSFNDQERLYELQHNYQLEEVLPPGKTLNEKACREIIKERLIEHTVFAILDTTTSKFVSMAGTNAKGIHYVQLGGIFTNPQYRNLGLAQTLVRQLIAYSNKNISLFVRKENYSAIKAYANSGFVINSSYRICYI